jgi:hypothetical protein
MILQNKNGIFITRKPGVDPGGVIIFLTSLEIVCQTINLIMFALFIFVLLFS